MIKKLIVANWKMNPRSQKEADTIFSSVYNFAKISKNADVVVCPPFPFLSIGKKIKSQKVSLGAQNVSYAIEGAYTGEVSPLMLVSFGVKYVIVGHSEVRSQGETNEIINKKLLNIFKNKLTPILCIGESVRDSHGEYLSFIKNQILLCLANVSKTQMINLVVAYEPVWAIGESATREATPEEFVEISIFIRKIISDLYGAKIAHSIKILYGGSVHSENAKLFLLDGHADGLLVGRDSLNPKKFGAIINATE